MFNLREFLGLGYYTSGLDEFLASYDKNCPQLSASQRQEIEKHKKVFTLRDNPLIPQPKKKFWDNF